MDPLSSWIFLGFIFLGLLVFWFGVTTVLKGIEGWRWGRRVKACDEWMMRTQGRHCTNPEQHR